MVEREAVQIWRLRPGSLAEVEERMVFFRSLLSQEELLRADGLQGEGHRREYVTAHAALRMVIGKTLNVAPASLRFGVQAPIVGYAVDGPPSKPVLLNSETGFMPDLRFNLSHTAGAALIAVALDREVGVDIERNRALEDLDAMAASIFSEEEMALWRSIGHTDRLTAFYRVWTRKEAYLKAIGLGLFADLQGVTVPADPQFLVGPGKAAKVSDRAGAGEWWVADLNVEEGCSAAVCWQGTGVETIEVRDLDLTNGA